MTARSDGPRPSDRDALAPAGTTRRSVLGYAGAVAGTLVAGGAAPSGASAAEETGGAPYRLSPLPYDHAALEPVIDRETMVLHHDRHHQAYIDATNEALSQYPALLGRPIEDLLRGLNQVPEAVRTTIRNQGGGHANHQLFWRLMKPGGSPIPDGLRRQIEADFGSLEAMKAKFEDAGVKQFGSGWVFLVADSKATRLEILATPNQDSPLLLEGKTALLGNDVWEHAYYLKYRNARAAYLKAWWDVVHWAYVGERWSAVREGRSPA